eukprot:jgi/Psemu1/296971/fgenesh1_pm.220_\
MDESDDGTVNDVDHVEMAPLTTNNNAEDTEELKVKSGDINLESISSPCAYVSYGIHYNPRIFWSTTTLCLVLPLYYLIADTFFNPTEHFGVIEHDYSNLDLRSNFDFQMRNIDHWCLKGDNDSCRCEDPTNPSPRSEYRRWTNAHAGNMLQIRNMIDQGITSPDIAFLGGSVVEKMDGRWFGDISQQGLSEVAQIFNKNFSGKDGSMTAIALGIAADENKSVLWRILNGEMPDEFNPKIWWLELGLNDLGRSQCSEEVVVIGVLRVVEEIMKLKPDAKIVINSLFPMTDLRAGLAPTQEDLAKSFRNKPEQRLRERVPKLPQSDRNDRVLRERPERDADGFRDRNRGANHDRNHGKNHDRNRGTNHDRNRGKNHDRNHDRNRIRNRDKKLIDRKSQHKFNSVTRRERKLPLWTSIRAINMALRKFCDQNENVSFFDSTMIFAERDGLDYTLNTDMISLTGLPTNAGYINWENAVAIRAKQLLE